MNNDRVEGYFACVCVCLCVCALVYGREEMNRCEMNRRKTRLVIVEWAAI